MSESAKFGKVGVGLQELQDCSADAVFSFKKATKKMPEVRERASAFIFSVTTHSATWKTCGHSLLSFEVRRLALSLTMSHATTSLGNHEAQPHKLPWQPHSAATKAALPSASSLPIFTTQGRRDEGLPRWIERFAVER